MESRVKRVIITILGILALLMLIQVIFFSINMNKTEPTTTEIEHIEVDKGAK